MTKKYKNVRHKEKVPMPHFNYVFWVLFADDPEAYADGVGAENANERNIPSTTAALCVHYPAEMRCDLVFRPNVDPGCVAHEAWHGVRHLLLDAGAILDNETVAYHIGYLVNQIHNIRKVMMKKRKKA